MKYPITQIKIGPRQRLEMGDITDLADSLRRLGQIHSIGLRPDGTLIWGMRRTLAAQSLGWQEIEATVRENLSESDAFEIELEEDIRRKDRTWQEETLAVSRLFAIKARQARDKGEKFTIREMANYTGFGKTMVAEYVYQVGAALSKEPRDEALWSAPDYSAALELLRERTEREAYHEMQERRAALVNMPLPTVTIATPTDMANAISPGSVQFPDQTGGFSRGGLFMVECANLQPVSTQPKKLSLHERVLNYNHSYAHLWNQQLVIFNDPKNPADQFITGYWFVGGGNISSLYGSYQVEYLKRITTLFPETGKQEVVHLFSGSIPVCDLYTVVGLPDHDCQPDIVCDAHNLSSGLSFAPTVIFADPPYSVEDSEHYANSMVNRERVVSECAVALRPGGYLVWLDQALPIFSADELKHVGCIAYIRSTGNRFRTINIFQKCQNTISTPAPTSTQSPKGTEPSPTLPLS